MRDTEEDFKVWFREGKGRKRLEEALLPLSSAYLTIIIHVLVMEMRGECATQESALLSRDVARLIADWCGTVRRGERIPIRHEGHVALCWVRADGQPT